MACDQLKTSYEPPVCFWFYSVTLAASSMQQYQRCNLLQPSVIWLKPITDNVTYYIFGRWATQEAYAQHFKSEHTRRLLEFDAEKGIVFYIQPLLIVD